MAKFTKNTLKKLVIGILLTVSINIVFSQSSYTSEFNSPLKIPLFLSGNYGELRSSHFHAGIDIKTQGKIGQPVYSAFDGYISRIKIQSGGYGNAIYITHPNGYKTVYGHLDRFNPEIQDYVKRNQYKLQKFEVNLYPPKTKFILGKGQQFAFSGNSGRSGGPHLHFEIRKANGDIPLNVLRFSFPVTDNQSPEFRNLFVYSFPGHNTTGNNGEERKMYSIKRKNDSIYFVNEIIELNYNFCGFGVEVYDFLNGSANRCGVYSLELSVNEIYLFSFFIDAIAFPKTRYINAHMDYDLKANKGKSVHRLFMLPNNKLPVYSKNIYRGLYNSDNDSLYYARVIANDAYGNRSYLEFKFRKSKNNAIILEKDETKLVRWKDGNEFIMNKCRVKIPGGALYRDIYFDYSEIASTSVLSDTIKVHYETEALHKNITVMLTPDSVPENLKSKLLIARINENGMSYEGGEWEDGQLIAYTRHFGKFFITVDTVSPKIIPVQFKENGEYTHGQSLKFKVTDNLSGFKSYNVYIDNKWALLKYDAKNNVMIYTIDKRLSSGSSHSLKLIIVDRKNNIAIFESKFNY